MTEIYDIKNSNDHAFKCTKCNIIYITDEVTIAPQWKRIKDLYWLSHCPKCGKEIIGEYYN